MDAWSCASQPILAPWRREREIILPMPAWNARDVLAGAPPDVQQPPQQDVQHSPQQHVPYVESHCKSKAAGMCLVRQNLVSALREVLYPASEVNGSSSASSVPSVLMEEQAQGRQSPVQPDWTPEEWHRWLNRPLPSKKPEVIAHTILEVEEEKPAFASSVLMEDEHKGANLPLEPKYTADEWHRWQQRPLPSKKPEVIAPTILEVEEEKTVFAASSVLMEEKHNDGDIKSAEWDAWHKRRWTGKEWREWQKFVPDTTSKRQREHRQEMDAKMYRNKKRRWARWAESSSPEEID